MIGCSVLRCIFPVCKPSLVHGKLFVCTSEKVGACQAVALKENLYICVINKSRHTNKGKTI